MPQHAANKTSFARFLGYEHGRGQQKRQEPANETQGNESPAGTTIPAGTQTANMKHNTSKSADQPHKAQPAIARLRAFMRTRF